MNFKNYKIEIDGENNLFVFFMVDDVITNNLFFMCSDNIDEANEYSYEIKQLALLSEYSVIHGEITNLYKQLECGDCISTTANRDGSDLALTFDCGIAGIHYYPKNTTELKNLSDDIRQWVIKADAKNPKL